MPSRRFAMVAFALVAAGSPGVAAPNASSRPEPSALDRAAFDRLATAFRRAHEARDLRALESLVHPAGIEADGLDTFRLSAGSDFAYRIASVRFEGLKPGVRLEYVRGGRTWRPNLKPIGWVRVHFAKPVGASGPVVTSSAYLVGRVGGEYRLATAIAS